MNDWMKRILIIFSPLVDESEERKSDFYWKKTPGGFSEQISNLKIVEINEDF